MVLHISDISDLVQSLFQQSATFVDIGHHEDLRNYVLLVNGNIILKVYGSKNRWQRELENLIKLHTSKFITPMILDYGFYKIDIAWIIMSVIPGQIIEEKYPFLSSTNKKKLWHYIGELLGDFHISNLVNLEDINFPDKKSQSREPKTYKVYIESQYRCDKQDIVNNNYYFIEDIYQSVFDEIETWLDSFNPDETLQYTLCHRDFCLRNILYDSLNNTFGLIDFEMSYNGQPESDFARIILQLLQEGDFLCDFLAGYYNTNRELKKDNNIIRKYLLIKIIEICSWSFERAPAYYQNTVDILRQIIKSKEIF